MPPPEPYARASSDWRNSVLGEGGHLGGIGLTYGLVGLGFLAYGLIRFPPSAAGLPDLLVAAGLIALACAFPFPLGRVPTSLGFIPALVLAYGPDPQAVPWALLVGTAAGTGLDLTLHPSGQPRTTAFAWGWTRSALTQAVPTLALTLLSAWLLPGWMDAPSLVALLPAAVVWALFVGMFVFAHWLLLPIGPNRSLQKMEWASLAALASLPLPYAALAGSAYALWGTAALLVFGGVPAGLSPVIRGLILTQRKLERRLAELSTVGKISQVMQTSLDKETVLNAIFLQVSTLLNVDNFYLAVADERTQTLSYPLAIKSGLRQAWPTRPIADRLTDRVIRTRAPILIPGDAAQALQAMGMPELDNPPESWLGVPLLTSGATIGCLAVFHLERGRTLSSADLELMQTLAGQASAALANADLFEQARSRAEILTSINQVTSALRSTLDPDHTLELIVRALADVSGSNRLAIYLHDASRRQLFLARASGLSDAFLSGSMVIEVEDPVRARGFREQRVLPLTVGEDSGIDAAYLELLRREGIRALVQLPLSTPEGCLGQVSIYFDGPLRLSQDQVDVLDTIAGQAALAIAMSHQHAETDQALRRRLSQISALEAIGRDINSTLSLEELLERVLGHAMRYTGAAAGQIALFDERAEEYRTRCTAEPVPGTGRLKLGRPKATRSSRLAWIAGRNDPMTIAERSELPSLEPLVGLQTESVLAAPIHRQGKRLGVLLLESPQAAAFDSEQSRFLAQLAAEAAVALANVRLYEQLEARLREQSLLFQISAELAQAVDSTRVGYAVVESLGGALDADWVRLYQPEAETGQLVLRVQAAGGKAVGLPPDVDRAPPPHVLASYEEGRLVQAQGATPSADAASRDLPPQTIPTWAAVPVLAGEHRLGAIELGWLGSFSLQDSHVRMAMTVASQAAVALQGAALFARISQSNNRLLAVLKSAHEGMLMADIAGRVLIVNPQLEELTGLTAGGLIGKTLSDRSIPLAKQLGYSESEVQRLLDDLRQGAAVPGASHEFDTQDPRPRSLERSEAPVRDAQEVLIGWLVVLRDISEQKGLERAREQLTEMIVHDLRSPLTAILGSLKLLQTSIRPDDRTALTDQALTVSQRSCQQMMEMVSSLLDLAKLESGELQLRREQVSLESLCHDLIALHIPEANALGIILALDVQPGLPSITADAGMVRRCLSNLLDNALKFTPQGGRVTLSVESRGDHQVLAVEDTGPGIPPEYRQRVFERFGQIPGAAGRRRGTGLGLPFARLAIEAHGGSLTVLEGADGGARFEIALRAPPTTDGQA